MNNFIANFNGTSHFNYSDTSVPNFTYTINGVPKIITAFPLSIMNSSNLSNPATTNYILCLSISSSVFTDQYESFKTSLFTRIYIQIGIVGSVVLMLFISAL